MSPPFLILQKSSNFLPLGIFKANCLILSSYTTGESPNTELQSTEHVLGRCSAYALGAESHDKVCDDGEYLCHSVVCLCGIDL